MTETPLTEAALMPKYLDGSGNRLEYVHADFARQLERELNKAKELMKTAAIWIEACPFENSIPLGLKLRAAAMPNTEFRNAASGAPGLDGGVQ